MFQYVLKMISVLTKALASKPQAARIINPLAFGKTSVMTKQKSHI